MAKKDGKKDGIPATLTRKELVADDTYELEFDLHGRTIDFAAGQYCRIALPRLLAPDRKTSRKFSLINPPQQNDRVVITTRTGVTGYKCTLCALDIGDEVQVQKIKGKLVLPAEPTRPLVFIAGGIGVVPFVSMLHDLEHRGQLNDVTLLYFNRTPETAPYLADLQDLARRHPGFRLALSMTRHTPWTGETQRLNAEFLVRLLGDLNAYDYYVVGTPAMVDAAVRTLRSAGVRREQVFDEDFSGYDSDRAAG